MATLPSIIKHCLKSGMAPVQTHAMRAIVTLMAAEPGGVVDVLMGWVPFINVTYCYVWVMLPSKLKELLVHSFPESWYIVHLSINVTLLVSLCLINTHFLLFPFFL